MDIYCLNCGEPWDIFEVNDDKESFSFSEPSTGKITACPSCQGKTVDLSPKQKAKLESVAAIADLLGDDVDGLASMLEDMEYLGYMDDE